MEDIKVEIKLAALLKLVSDKNKPFRSANTRSCIDVEKLKRPAKFTSTSYIDTVNLKEFSWLNVQRMKDMTYYRCN
jgi:hypothetical protein